MINISNILINKPIKTIKLYSSAVGVCEILNISYNNIIIKDIKNHDDYSYNEFGVFSNTNGECTLFPSKNMKDWERFSWKRGDVLSYGGDNFCIFDRWANDDYTQFHSKLNNSTYSDETYNTLQWFKVDNENTILRYISNIEKIKHGKFNMSTLEIEKQEEFKDGDIVQIDDDKFIILKRIEPYRIYYHYCYKDGNIDINGWVSRANQTMKLASKADCLTILSHLKTEGKIWNPNTKQIENLTKKYKFKPMDWCLMRRDFCRWELCQFSWKCNGLYHSVGGCLFHQCIPYNDNTAHLLGTTDNYE